MPKTFAAFSAAHKSSIDQQLNDLFKIQVAAAMSNNQPYAETLQELGILIGRGGKRLRPLLLLLAYQGYGGKQSLAVLRAAISQELVHAFLLIHDDIIDRDSTRWGGLNIHGVYFERYSRTMTPRDALHFGQSQALLAGDSCMMLANQSLLSSGFDPVVLTEALQLQQQLVQTVVGGEVAETSYAVGRLRPTEKQILDMYGHKTASYSFALPLRLGAMLAGAPDDVQATITKLAHDVGIAFQLQDDLLGTFGSTAATGKPAMGDIREGKTTILIVKALKTAKPAAKKELLAVLGNQDASPASLQAAKTILIDCGARDYVRQLALSYAQKASTTLKQCHLNASSQAILQDLIEQLTIRDR